MKKVIIILSLLILLTGCQPPGLYILGDYLPPQVNVKTQLHYIETIIVTDCSSGESFEYTGKSDQELIYTQFEKIPCIRKKYSGDDTPLYKIEFVTADGVTTLSVLSEYEFILDGYRYEAMRYHVDLFVLKELTKPE